METPVEPNLFEIQIDQTSISYLGETARWARFLGIVGFIFCGLMILVGIFLGSVMATMMEGFGGGAAGMFGGGFFSFFYIACSLLIFFPSLYLFNFGKKTRRAIATNDQLILTDALKNLKSFFKFYGIFTIIILGFYALALFAGIGGMMMGRH